MTTWARCLFAALTLGCLPVAADENRVTFYAMGDTPYSPTEYLLLPQQIRFIPKDAEFVVHLGDIKIGAAPCNESAYTRVAAILAKSRAPVFIVPGDNEWNDCQDPDTAWKYWQKHLLRFEQKWPHEFRVFRPLEREENFSLVRNRVLILGLNIVGGKVHDKQEWATRLASCLAWTRKNTEHFRGKFDSIVVLAHAQANANHKAFFKGFVEDAKNHGLPTLYLHGDGHRWIKDRPWKDAANILRVQVDMGSIAQPLKVTVTDDKRNPFVFDRRK